jgi:murein DD-endopeptidase MepM/ murein hydrolase activator NlpD
VAISEKKVCAQGRFVSPIAGVYGKDYILVNYVEWAAGTVIGDHYCKTKTYDGHQGSDFVIRSFKVQDSGLDVRVTDNGRVIFTKDGIFDREKTSVVSKLLGDYVGITHSGKLQTYYGHLCKGLLRLR